MIRFKFAGDTGILRRLVFTALLCSGLACSAHAAATFNPIPTNTYGTHFGYWEYLSSSYYTSTKPLPIVIFFHGAGEVGNGQLPAMNVILKLGPPLIANDVNHPLHNIFEQNEVIMLAPQCPDGNGQFTFWFNVYVLNFINYAQAHYGNRIDTNRVYLTGLSMGSGGIHELINAFPADGMKAAAMVVTAAVGGANDTGAAIGPVVPYWCLTAYGDSPWGTIDGINRMAGKIAGTAPTDVMANYPGSDVTRTATFSPSTGWTWQLGTNGASGVSPKLTLYPGSDHWSWGPTYDNPTVWNWMFAQRKSSGVDATAPTVSITSPTTGAPWTTTNPILNLAGMASDNVGVTQVFWSNDRGGSGIASGTANWSVNNIVLHTGTNILTVTAQDAANNRTSATLSVTLNTIPVLSSGSNGLNAEYYNSVSLTGLVFTRVDAKVDNNWANGGPGNGVSSDNFSVRWSGRLLPRFSETYTFSTISDDGARLWVNGQLLIDNWADHPPTENTGTITLQAGVKYDIKMEYYERSGGAVAQLLWASASQAREIIPTSQLFANGFNAEYYNSRYFSGAAIQQLDPMINFDWGNASPMSGISADGFTVRWTGRIQPRYPETYTFYTQSDDGVRLWVNGQLIIDNWTDHGTTENTGTITLQAGQKYDIKMEYYENSGAAVAKLFWSSASQAKEIVPSSQVFPDGNGLIGEYFNTIDLSGPVLIRTDASINFDWAYGSPDASLNADYFSVRWVGKVMPKYSENYTFYTQSDDGVRLWVNGQLLIDNWTLHGSTENAGNITLQAGQKYDIKMEYYENWGAATAKLSWSSARQAKEIVPESQLFPSGTGLNVQYFNNMALSNASLERIDETVNFDWGNGSPTAAISADNISARWSGKVQPLFSENYTFSTITDDGVRLWVNGQLLIDDWTLHGPTERAGNISLQAGQKYDIKMEWFENSGGAVAKLSWQSASQAKGIIPQSQLYAVSSNTINATTALATKATKSISAKDVADASGATAVPSDASVGQPVAFTAPAIEAQNITFTWNFGDGTTADGANATHSYTAEGTYTATVTITDAIGGTSSSSVTVNVSANKPIKVKKLQVALNFKNANSDSIAVSGSFAVEKSFNPTGKQVFIDIGGVTKNFILNSKGIAAKGSDSFKLKRTKKLATEAQFQLRLKNGSFSGELADEGLTNADSKNQRKSIGLNITLDDAKYSTAIKATYSGAKGKFGRAK